MAEQLFPYTYYSCPCVDTSAPLPILSASRRLSKEQTIGNQYDENIEQQTFDPKAPRANLSLVPLEYLLWCTECHEIRCSRCVLEEVVCWYCPTCLFEVPSSTVRSEGNRCTRNCYNCPLCTSPLTVNPLESQPVDAKSDAPTGPFILMCGWCNWSSLDIDIKLKQHNNLTAQLNKIKQSRQQKTVSAKPEKEETRDGSDDDNDQDDADGDGEPKSQAESLDPEDMFMRLNKFYRQQITESSDSPFPGGYNSSDMAFSSPSTISRLLNMYSGKRTKRLKPKPMREALSIDEGLFVINESAEYDETLRHLNREFRDTTDITQRAFQPGISPRLVSNLWPVASLLRTKRQKRCKTCRHLLVKPEARMTSSRWRIRLLALNHIPKVNLRALAAPASIGPYLGGPPAASGGFDYRVLQTGRMYQFLLTIVNPLFEVINVTLATASTTPGRVGNRITILCPQFSVGANSDVWDEALDGASKRKSVMPGATMQLEAVGEDDSQKQAEAGKTWAKGRNWASVIMEVVPGILPPKEELEEDEDLLEIAVFVHVEYEHAVTGEDKQTGANAAAKEKRETAFWSVLGAGQIQSS